MLAAMLVVCAAQVPRTASAQVSARAGNVTLRLTIPEGVPKVKGVLAFTVRGIASGWARSPGFRDLATRLQAAIVMVEGGDDLNDNSYPNRCASGEFNGIPQALAMLATASNHPELAHAPMVGIGHSHGGDYWNWFNACHPERMAMVFVHASGGVNYSAAALKTPVVYELGTGDLIENGSKKPRAGMFANRSKGAPMSLVIGQGEGHDNVTPLSLGMVIELIEGIFKLRVPADSDGLKGPVRLNDINEASGKYWVGDLYTKEVAAYGAFTGNKALTSFLPSEAIARKWKETGPGLPMSIELPSGTCGWCGNPKDEPKASAAGPEPEPWPSDAGGGVSDAGSGEPDAGQSTPPTFDAAAPTPPVSMPAPAPEPRPGTGGSTGNSGTGGSGGGVKTSARGSSVSGGCSVVPGTGGSPSWLWLALAVAGAGLRVGLQRGARRATRSV